MLPDLFVSAATVLKFEGAESKKEIDASLGSVLPNVPRRLNVFIKTALAGAASCVQNKGIDAADVYLFANAVSHEVMEDLVVSTLLEKEQPKPISFIHSIGNSASFYISQQLKLTGESLFFVDGENGFAELLLLTAVKMSNGSSTILLGHVNQYNGGTQTCWALLTKQKQSDKDVKISFTSVSSEINSGSNPLEGNSDNKNSECFYQFCTAISDGRLPNTVDSSRFQQQSGLAIQLSY